MSFFDILNTAGGVASGIASALDPKSSTAKTLSTIGTTSTAVATGFAPKPTTFSGVPLAQTNVQQTAIGSGIQGAASSVSTTANDAASSSFAMLAMIVVAGALLVHARRKYR